MTKNLGDRVAIRIRDNGTGISPEVKEKMFNPFFTTKPAGEGTGLGLSISHDIIVKQHGGSIEVDTQPGEFTEIRVIVRARPLLIKIFLGGPDVLALSGHLTGNCSCPLSGVKRTFRLHRKCSYDPKRTLQRSSLSEGNVARPAHDSRSRYARIALVMSALLPISQS